MTLVMGAALIAAGFLSGSLPTGLLIARRRGIDIRLHGSGNIGATNVGRVLGRRAGILCFAIDMAKGLVPTIIAGAVIGAIGRLDLAASDAWWWLAAMAAPILGHVFNPWLKFKGGKGVATALGSLLAVFPALSLPALAAAALWLGSIRVCRYVGLSSVIAASSLPALVALEFALAPRLGVSTTMRAGIPFIAVTGALAALVVAKHRANLARTAKGTEPRVSWIGAKRPEG